MRGAYQSKETRPNSSLVGGGIRPGMKALSHDAIRVLSLCTITDALVFLPPGQLDRKLYVEVNAALEAIGGKWNKKAKAHIFDGDPADALDQVLSDGSFTDRKRDLDQFFTPASLAADVVKAVGVHNLSVLEPSAGGGALVIECIRKGAASVRMVEKDPKLAQALMTHTFTGDNDVEQEDFMVWRGPSARLYDRVVMNPPFSKQQDIAHVMKAFGHLRPQGKLIAIMAAGVSFRGDKKSVAFREHVAAFGTMVPLPAESFKESWTSVNTVLVTLHRPAPEPKEEL